MCKGSNTVFVCDVVQAAMEMLKKQQYGAGPMEKHKYIYRRLITFSENHYGGKYYPDVGETFLRDIANKEPPLSHEHVRTYILAVKRLDKALNGITEWSPTSGKIKDYAQSRFDETVMAYESYMYSTGKLASYIRSYTHVAARFLRFVDLQGVTSLSELTPQHIYAAFQATTDNKGSFHKMVFSFLRYAYRYALTVTDLSSIVPSVRRGSPLPSVYTPEEVELLLASIDRTTPTGNRNYAMALIAARLGLRASDIADLTFDNVNFDKGIIRVIQVKTGQPLELPLLPEVREALLTYMTNNRPQSDSPYIFLQSRRFRHGPLRSNYLYKIISRYFEKAPINSEKRHIGPRALRSSLATALLEEGNDYPAISRVLGHKNPQAAKFYVKMDIKHLRLCALPVPALSGDFDKLLAESAVSL